MRLLMICLAMFAISCVEDDDGADSAQSEIVGFWFPCDDPPGAAGSDACDLVDDDGLYFSASDSISRIDGAMAYAKAKMGDTAAGMVFDIHVSELYFFEEKEALAGTYSIEGDSLFIEGYSAETEESVRERVEISFAAGGILVIEGGGVSSRRMRKYAGKANLVTKSQWEDALK